MAGNSLHTTSGIITAAAGRKTPAASASVATAGGGSQERSCAGLQDGQALRCPRCDSSNTKFCYYNNYSLSQPRHFCKACKRYWTRGGILRNVPVGGRCRKNKRPKKSRSTSSTFSFTAASTTSSADPRPMSPLSSHPNPTPVPTAAASSPGPLLYGHGTDMSQMAFTNPCISYDLQSQFRTLGLFSSDSGDHYHQDLKPEFPDHCILQQTATAAVMTPSVTSLLHDYSLFGSNPLAWPHVSCLKQQLQQRIHQNTNLSLYATLLADATGGNSALLNNVDGEGGAEGIMTDGGTDHWFNRQIPSRDNAMEAQTHHRTGTPPRPRPSSAVVHCCDAGPM